MTIKRTDFEADAVLTAAQIEQAQDNGAIQVSTVAELSDLPSTVKVAYCAADTSIYHYDGSAWVREIPTVGYVSSSTSTTCSFSAGMGSLTTLTVDNITANATPIGLTSNEVTFSSTGSYLVAAQYNSDCSSAAIRHVELQYYNGSTWAAVTGGVTTASGSTGFAGAGIVNQQMSVVVRVTSTSHKVRWQAKAGGAASSTSATVSVTRANFIKLPV